MRTLVSVFLVFCMGCVPENSLISQLPGAVVSNPRPLESSIQTDKLVQVEVPKVDILWVVDNSCSMDAEQAQLAANFPVFMSYFLNSGLDYHIGLTTMDMSASGARGILQPADGYRWVTPDTPEPEAVFAQMTQVGTHGSADEMGRDAAYAALEIQTQPLLPNEGFVRDEAAMHIVVISDEDDDSESLTAGEFISYLENMKDDPEMVTFSSIVSTESGCPTVVGDDYVAITQAVGGEWESICELNWEPMLDRLGLQASGLKREYFLSQLPVPGTIGVWVEEALPNNEVVVMPFEEELDWVYNAERNSIEFIEYVPNALSQVFVEYEVLATAEELEDSF